MKARKIRQRSISVADDEGDDGASEALRKSVAARKQQKEKKGSKKPSLSFDDEEEPQVVPIKRPPSKIRPDLKGLKIAYPDVAKQSTQRSAPGDYSAEKLLELQRNTVRLPSSKPAVDASQAVPPPAFKLSGSFKQAGAQTSVPQPNTSNRAHARQDADDDMPLPPPARPACRPPLPPSLPSQARANPGAADDDDLPTFQAPDEDTIRKIKERRARLQHVHMAPDYIPVAGAGMDTLRNDAKAESGSGSDSEPDAGDQLRMSFLGDTKKRGKAAPGVFAQVAEDAQAPDDDADADDRWIDEQIRKGTGGGADPTAVAAARSAAAAAAAAPGPGRAFARQLDGLGAPAAASGVWQQQPEQLARVGQDVMLSLQQGVAQLQASHKNAQKQLQRTSQNLTDSISAIDALEEQLQSAGTRYTFLQQIKAYIADLCDMLQAKSPIVEELQDHMMGLQQHRGQIAAENSAGNDREEMAPAEAAVQAALGVLSRGGAEASATAGAERAADAAEANLLENLPEKLDEFGRDENVERREEMSRRAQKRAAQYSTPPAQPQNAAEERWGDATTDESDSELAHYCSKRAEALEASASVFADASEEYGSLAAVKGRLEKWKQQHPGAYADAYMSLSVPAVMAPFVRLELLQWDPLFGSSTGFDSQEWYKQLFEYGLNGGNSTAGNGSDPDEELVPRLVGQLVLPLAAHSLQHAWNPHSRRSTAAAKAMLEDLLIYVPPEEPKLQDLLASIRRRLERAVAGTRLPPWPPTATAASRRATIFLARRFGKALRLLHNILTFDGVLPRSVLQDLALVQLMQKQLLPYLRAGAASVPVAVDRASRVLADIARLKGLTQGSAKVLEPLAEFLSAMARALEAQQNRSTAKHVELAKQLAKLLTVVGSSARSQELLAAFPG